MSILAELMRAEKRQKVHCTFLLASMSPAHDNRTKVHHSDTSWRASVPSICFFGRSSSWSYCLRSLPSTDETTTVHACSPGLELYRQIIASPHNSQLSANISASRQVVRPAAGCALSICLQSSASASSHFH